MSLRHDLEPGDSIRLNDDAAEVIKTYSVGDLEYLRVYVEDDGVKTVCIDDVEIELQRDQLSKLEPDTTDQLHPDHDAVSAEWFDLRSQALRLQIAHEQGQLLSISNSLVRLEPYQLDAVNWVMQKLRQRVLIADDVGLGKTIEAGLILKELAARNRADRVLFIVPAHLQKKWIRDMDRFFDIDLTLADRKWVEGERRRLGEETNIWGQDNQRLIGSMAFLRQDEFQNALDDAFWDVVVVDEAHKAAKRGDSPAKRAKMVERVAGNSDSLLLLSATPHDGKGEAFRSLVEYIDPFLVAENQELSKDVVDRVMIRRGKQMIYDENGDRIFPDREVNTVPVEMTHEERQFYRAVTDYVKNVYNRSEQLNEPAVGFAMALMQKRLVSSIGAIEATLKRRLRDLVEEQSTSTDLSEAASAYLDGEDLDEDDKQQAETEIAGLTVTESDAQLEEEIETLRDLVSLADGISVDSKAQKVRRYIQQLLEEQPDEKLLLFTEYRDTLDYLLELVEDEPWADEILVIHGDVDKDDRARIEEEFNHGQSRLLFATDAASEGIDLQHSCHIMVNYELPWNPNRLEQRIGRIHRYGQDKEVTVWNFSFEDTREGEIFEMLQERVENIRDKLGSTADVLGMLDDINVDSLIMESIQNEEPPSATKEELADLIDDRQQTLEEWYERSLIDTTTFDQESREKIQEVMDESEDVYGTEADIREFVEQSVKALGGRIEKVGSNLFEAELPDQLDYKTDGEYGPFTFSRDFAIDHDDIDYLSPDDEVVQRLMRQVLDSEHGDVGLKLLPFVETPGIAYNYRIRFEDGTGDVVREEMVPVFVDNSHQDPHQRLGKRVVQGNSVKGTPNSGTVHSLVQNQDQLRAVADQYISQRVASLRDELHEQRRAETQQELDDLEEYAESERQRIEQFLEEYERKAEAGSDMEIAIRGQEERLNKLERRIDERRKELERKARVISHAPEVANICLTFPV
ncbi:helicase-related protein [Halapricum desulfuricans]|uniref:Superfamily II DNA/RNA helicase, SNF2 family n=1 Tax=Halapricum desulfuricans TaxID=2841257 RepID=A0A897NEM2_9EURY|nr:helicase-related protein [Halapricum desulfuricans]QSG08826.1 Superfamily II DNA/RNA helicase, SNF2 family [Halapricum desulfuricans]